MKKKKYNIQIFEDLKLKNVFSFFVPWFLTRLYIKTFIYLFILVYTSQSPAYFSMQKMPLPLYPEVRIIPKDGGARSDGHSDAATKSATVRLQTGPVTERGERPCCPSPLAPGWRCPGSPSAAETAGAAALAEERRCLRGTDGEERQSSAEALWTEPRVSMRARRGSTRVVLPLTAERRGEAVAANCS